MIVGCMFALLAALASGSGSILESIGVRRAGAFGGTAMDLARLRHQWTYALGLTVDVAGFALAVAALHRLPLFLVQAVLAFSVGVTATISVIMGMRLPRLGWLALGAGATGLVVLAWSAEPSPSRALPAGWSWLLPALVIPIAGAAVLARHVAPRWSAAVLAFGAGLGFSVVGVAARTLVVPDSAWRVLLQPSTLAILVNGAAAAVLFAMALQRGGATTVAAIMFTTTTTVPAIIGLVALDDRVRAGFAGFAAAGLVLAVAGAIGTAHFSASAGWPTRRDSAAAVAATMRA